MTLGIPVWYLDPFSPTSPTPYLALTHVQPIATTQVATSISTQAQSITLSTRKEVEKGGKTRKRGSNQNPDLAIASQNSTQKHHYLVPYVIIMAILPKISPTYLS